MRKLLFFLLFLTGLNIVAQQSVFYPVKITKNTYKNDTLKYSDTVHLKWDEVGRIRAANENFIDYSDIGFSDYSRGEKSIGSFNDDGKLITFEDKYATYTFKYDDNKKITDIDQNYLDEEVPDFTMISYTYKEGNIIYVSEMGTIYEIPYSRTDSIYYFPDKINTLPFIIGLEGISFDNNAITYSTYGFSIQIYPCFLNATKNLIRQIVTNEWDATKTTDFIYKIDANNRVETIEINNDGLDAVKNLYILEY